MCLWRGEGEGDKNFDSLIASTTARRLMRSTPMLPMQKRDILVAGSWYNTRNCIVFAEKGGRDKYVASLGGKGVQYCVDEKQAGRFNTFPEDD